ncbi:MAG TPA: hypothetical protein VIF57_19810 [Polyangia bacterium]|jgi:hypothetical protein
MHAQKDRLLPVSLALLIAGVLAIWLAGCSNDLPVASVLERTRVLGARVEIASDPGRAEVSPGEAATVAWIVAGPAAPATLDWAFALCTTTTAGAACREAPQPIAAGNGQPVVAPFTTPDAATLGTDVLPLMLGEICADGTLGVDPNTATGTCAGAGASGTSVQFVVPVAADGATPNRHPVLSNDVIQLGGVDWDPATGTAAAAGGACDATTGLPVVMATPAGKDAVKAEIRIVSDGDDRESFTPAGKTEAQLEELQISNFTTAGKFDSSYAAIFATDTRPDADVTVKWEPPAGATVQGGGEVVQFYFVVRDLRGGLDWTSRALCLLAP